MRKSMIFSNKIGDKKLSQIKAIVNEVVTEAFRRQSQEFAQQQDAQTTFRHSGEDVQPRYALLRNCYPKSTNSSISQSIRLINKYISREKKDGYNYRN